MINRIAKACSFLLSALLICALILFAADRLIGAPAVPQTLCMDEETRDLARGIALEGIALALKDHTKRIFDIWMKDDSDQPARATAGMRNGVNAFKRARDDLLKWQPPSCKGDKQ